MFYGREKDLDDIVRQISDESGKILQGRCLALYGQTRTGKSSLLYHLERRLREIHPEGNIIVNIGSIGEEDLSGNDITEFLYTLLDGLKHEIDSNHPPLKERMKAAGLEIDVDRLLEAPDYAQLYFNSTFKEVTRFLESVGEKYNIVVMIDEFTYILDSPGNHDGPHHEILEGVYPKQWDFCNHHRTGPHDEVHQRKAVHQ